MAIQVTVPVSQEPITLPEVKQYLRVDFPDDDMLLTDLISQAREYGEFETRRAFAPQTIQALLEVPLLPDGPLSGAIGYRQSKLEIPMPPLVTFISAEGETTPGIFQTIDPSNYVIDTVQNPGIIYLLSSAYSFLGSQWSLWIGPYNPRFRLTYQAGYTQATFPYTLKRALLELVAFWYTMREGRDEAGGGRYGGSESIPGGIQSKFNKFRVYYG